MRISPSKSLIISGVLGATLAPATLAFLGSSVPEGVWNYPVPGTIHVAFAVLLVVMHLLTAHGFWGLSRLQGAGRLVRVAALVGAAGQVLLSLAEAASATLVGVQMTSQAATVVGSAFGVASVVYGVPALVGGTALAMRNLLPGANWSVAISGAILLFLVTPANIAGARVLAVVALGVWSLVFVWMGRGLSDAAGSPTPGLTPPTHEGQP